MVASDGQASDESNKMFLQIYFHYGIDFERMKISIWLFGAI